MFMYNHESIEALEVCIRDNIPSYSAKVGIEKANTYLQFLYDNNAISKAQYETSSKILAVGTIGYALFNIVSDTQFRIYVAKPNLFGFTLDVNGVIVKQKEYIDDYYIDLSTGDKKYYHIISSESFPDEVSIPNTFIQIPIRALGDENGQTYYEFLSTAFMSEYIRLIEEEYIKAVEKLVGNDDESTWAKQEAEAKAWIVDNNINTPLIDGLIVARGKYATKQELVNKIIEKADSYANVMGSLLGQKQAKLDKLLIS